MPLVKLTFYIDISKKLNIMSLPAVSIANQSIVINQNMTQKKCQQDKWYILKFS